VVVLFVVSLSRCHKAVFNPI